MIEWLLNVVYVAVALAASPWLLYSAIAKGKYREGWAAKLLGRVPVRSGDRPCIWLHAVSLGEVNLLAPLIAELERRRPDCECVISTTTATGYAQAKKKYSPRSVFYCPLDFTWAVRAALARIRPQLLVLAELELWPNLISAAHGMGVPVALVNGRLSERSFRGYRRLGRVMAGLFSKIEVIAAQDLASAERFLSLGAIPERVVVTGSMKYDGAQTKRDNPVTRRLSTLPGFATDDVVFLAGSTQEPEEQLALATYRELAPQFPFLRLVIVPRHPERFPAVERMLAASGHRFAKRSELPVKCEPASETRILLVDAVGELAGWWGAAHVAFVGGSLCNRGGQNMIEPAAYGAAVCFGPNTRNFRDITSALLAADAAEVVTDGAELTAFVRRCLEQPALAADLGRRAQRLVQANLGAAAKTVELLLPLVAKASVGASARRAHGGRTRPAAHVGMTP